MFKKKRCFITYFTVFILLVFFQLPFPEIAHAAIHYVSNSGKATWANSTNISTPCSVSTAFANAAAGDVVNFRGGTYNIGAASKNNYPVYSFANSGTSENRITFQAYPGETPIINGTRKVITTGTAGAGTNATTLVDATKDFAALGVAYFYIVRAAGKTGEAAVNSRTNSTTVALHSGNHNTISGGGLAPGDTYTIYWERSILIGTMTPGTGANKSYVTLDGFTFQSDNGAENPTIWFYGDSTSNRGQGNIVKNCTFVGGTNPVGHLDNIEFIRIEYQSNTLVQKCTMHSLNHIREGTNDLYTKNTSAIKTYHCDGIIVENCEIYNCSYAIFYKSDTDNSIIRYNYLHHNREGICLSPDMAGMESDGLQIYHNVIVNTSDTTSNASRSVSFVSAAGTHGNDTLFYNNTVYYNSTQGRAVFFGVTEPTHGLTIYNNIVVSLATYSMVTDDKDAVYQTTLKTADHNQWGTPWRIIRIGENWRNHNYTSLANWKASTELEASIDVGCGSNQHPGCGDLTSDPLFVNGSRNLILLADFALSPNSPCKRAGRGGADMGANIDLVGILRK